jgi:membrane glycosyltransferase
VLVGSIGMTALAGGLFAPGFFWGKADWVVAVGGALLAGLCLFGHFAWLLWMIGFVGWKSRPRETYSPDELITTRTAIIMPIYHEDVTVWRRGSGRPGRASSKPGWQPTAITSC